MLAGVGLALWRGAVGYGLVLLLGANVMPTFAAAPLTDGGLHRQVTQSLVQAYGAWSLLLFAAPFAVAVAVGVLLRSRRRWALGSAWAAWALLAGACVLTLLTVGAAAAVVPVLLLGALLHAGATAGQTADVASARSVRAPRER